MPSIVRFRILNIDEEITRQELEEALENDLHLDDVDVKRQTFRKFPPYRLLWWWQLSKSITCISPACLVCVLLVVAVAFAVLLLLSFLCVACQSVVVALAGLFVGCSRVCLCALLFCSSRSSSFPLPRCFAIQSRDG